MNIIVTGSRGFIGKHLVADLGQRFPDAEICCLVRNKKAYSPGDRVTTFVVDYLDRKSLLNCPAFDQVDYIYHVAGVTKSASKKGFFEGNVVPTNHLIETLIEKKTTLKRFVLVSSQTASGSSNNRNHYKKEDELENPLELYGQSKLEAETLLRKKGNIIPYTIISPSSVYGPWDVDFLNIFRMTKIGINIFAGNKNQVISLVYVKDLVKAIIDASLSHKAENQKYFICDDEPRSWEEIQNVIFSLAGKKKVDITIPLTVLSAFSYFGSIYSSIANKPILLNRNKAQLLKSSYWIISNQKAKSDFFFNCHYSLAEGIKETYDWYREHRWL